MAASILLLTSVKHILIDEVLIKAKLLKIRARSLAPKLDEETSILVEEDETNTNPVVKRKKSTNRRRKPWLANLFSIKEESDVSSESEVEKKLPVPRKHVVNSVSSSDGFEQSQ